MSTETQYITEAWLVEEDEQLGNSSLPEAMFIIEIYVTDERAMFKQFPVAKNHLMHDRMSWSTLVNMLTQMNMPPSAHPAMIQKIMECASQGCSLNQNIIPMVVCLTALRSSMTFPEALAESFDLQGLRFVGASRSSIEALEKEDIEGHSKPCVICLEDILVGTTASRLPCSHVYHENCIKNWLENSSLCPLCRFQMPVIVN